MGFGLDAGAEDGENLGIGAGQRIGRRGGRAGGANLRHRFCVGDAADRAGDPVVGDDDALVPRPPRPMRIAEYADQLGAEGRQRRKLTRHGSEHLVLADGKDLPQRLGSLATRERDHGAAHDVDAPAIVEQFLHSGCVIEADRHDAPVQRA